MGALLALISAVFFALAAALQQRGQFSLARAGNAVHGASGLVRLLVVPVWLLGTSVLLIGYATQGAALDRGKLVIIQPLLVTTIVWTLPLGHWLTRQHVARRQVAGAAVVVPAHSGRDDSGWEYDQSVTTLATSVPLSIGDRRMTVPLFTLHECATYLQTPLSTLHAWTRPKDGAPMVTVLPSAGRQATVPFVGFAEAFVLGALRQAGVPMQQIRPAVKKLSDEIGLDHALASRRVYTDGAELIFDYASSSDDEALLTVVRTGQEHLAEVIREYLKRITYGDDGWAMRLHLPAYSNADVTVDPSEAFGQPLVVHGGARVEDLVDRFKAGDGFVEIAADFDVPGVEVEDVIRVALKLPA